MNDLRATAPAVVEIPAEYRDRFGSMSIRTTTKRIMLHCSATPAGREVTFADLWRWHVDDNGWSGPGYHWLIMLDGTIQECRPEHYVGAGCSGQNHDTVHICYAGGLRADGSQLAEDTRTEAQIASMIWLCHDVAERWAIGHASAVVGHNQFAAKACPSFDVPSWVEAVLAGAETGNPEPGDPELPADLVTYVRQLEARIARLEDHNARWGS